MLFSFYFSRLSFFFLHGRTSFSFSILYLFFANASLFKSSQQIYFSSLFFCSPHSSLTYTRNAPPGILLHNGFIVLVRIWLRACAVSPARSGESENERVDVRMSEQTSGRQAARRMCMCVRVRVRARASCAHARAQWDSILRVHQSYRVKMELLVDASKPFKFLTDSIRSHAFSLVTLLIIFII